MINIEPIIVVDNKSDYNMKSFFLKRAHIEYKKVAEVFDLLPDDRYSPQEIHTVIINHLIAKFNKKLEEVENQFQTSEMEEALFESHRNN